MAVDLSTTPMSAEVIRRELAALTARLDAARGHNIGFPGATDLDLSPVLDAVGRLLLNNVGDPWVDGIGANHSKPFERAVVNVVADLLRAPTGDRWGYVTSGGSEGNLYGLRLAAQRHPDAVVYVSDAAHPSMAKAADLVGLAQVRIRTTSHGELDYRDLSMQVHQRRDRPVVIAATAGTTMTEAVDDLRRIATVLDDAAVRRRFVHVDAALSGLPLALVDPADRPGFDFADGADTISASGHKFLGIPSPCGVVVARNSLRVVEAGGGYVGSPDSTISGSRSGHTPLMLWYALATLGLDGLRRRAEAARELAAHVQHDLVAMGWETFRHPHAFTVVMRTPPAQVLGKWVLVSVGGWSHVITMPGISREQVDEFLHDMHAAITAAPSMAPRRVGPARSAAADLRPAA
jgi:histidine decarboxylase